MLVESVTAPVPRPMRSGVSGSTLDKKCQMVVDGLVWGSHAVRVTVGIMHGEINPFGAHFFDRELVNWPDNLQGQLCGSHGVQGDQVNNNDSVC